jgi:chaperonin cofactor prefoldin
MTNEELFDDLKQFVAATVSQEVAGLRSELKADIKALDSKVSLLGDKVDLLDHKIDAVQDAIGESFQDHEKRITQLEQLRA